MIFVFNHEQGTPTEQELSQYVADAIAWASDIDDSSGFRFELIYSSAKHTALFMRNTKFTHKTGGVVTAVLETAKFVCGPTPSLLAMQRRADVIPISLVAHFARIGERAGILHGELMMGYIDLKNVTSDVVLVEDNLTMCFMHSLAEPSAELIAERLAALDALPSTDH